MSLFIVLRKRNPKEKGKDSDHPTDPTLNVHRLPYAPRAHVSLHHRSYFSFLSPTNRPHPHLLPQPLLLPPVHRTKWRCFATRALPPPFSLSFARHAAAGAPSSPSWRSTGVDRAWLMLPQGQLQTPVPRTAAVPATRPLLQWRLDTVKFSAIWSWLNKIATRSLLQKHREEVRDATINFATRVFLQEYKEVVGDITSFCN